MQSTRKDGGAGGVNLETNFLQLVEAEQQRSERSGRPFVIVKLQFGDRVEETLFARMCSALRDTDLVAWVERQKVIAAICTETGSCDPGTAGEAIISRLTATLADAPVTGGGMQLSFQTVPALVWGKGKLDLEPTLAR
jgi:hypothetical protein